MARSHAFRAGIAVSMAASLAAAPQARAQTPLTGTSQTKQMQNTQQAAGQKARALRDKNAQPKAEAGKAGSATAASSP